MLGSTACYLLDTTFLGADGKILNSAEVQKWKKKGENVHALSLFTQTTKRYKLRYTMGDCRARCLSPRVTGKKEINKYKTNQTTSKKNLDHRTSPMQPLARLLVKCSHKLLAKQGDHFISKGVFVHSIPYNNLIGVCPDLTLKSSFWKFYYWKCDKPLCAWLHFHIAHLKRHDFSCIDITWICLFCHC